jgi:hypothetical protein
MFGGKQRGRIGQGAVTLRQADAAVFVEFTTMAGLAA